MYCFIIFYVQFTRTSTHTTRNAVPFTVISFNDKMDSVALDIHEMHRFRHTRTFSLLTLLLWRNIKGPRKFFPIFLSSKTSPFLFSFSFLLELERYCGTNHSNWFFVVGRNASLNHTKIKGVLRATLHKVAPHRYKAQWCLKKVGQVADNFIVVPAIWRTTSI